MDIQPMGWWLPGMPLWLEPIKSALQRGIWQKNVPKDTFLYRTFSSWPTENARQFYQTQGKHSKSWFILAFFPPFNQCEIYVKSTTRGNIFLIGKQSRNICKRGIYSLQKYLDRTATEGKKKTTEEMMQTKLISLYRGLSFAICVGKIRRGN